MTAEEQVKEIVRMMGGTGNDAVFLVREYMDNVDFQISNIDKEIALIQAQHAALQKEVERIKNESK